MSKILQIIAIFLVLGGLLIPNFIFSSQAIASTVIDTSVTPNGYSFQRHSFCAVGLEWVFYQKAGVWYYQTGNVTGNTTTWSGPIATGGIDGRNEYQDLYFDGTYVHGVGITLDNFPTPNSIWYHRGIPYGNGTITWQADALVQGFYSEYTSATVCVNGSGYPFVSASYYTASASGVQLMHGSVNDGTYGSNTIDWPSGWTIHLSEGYPGFCGNVMISMSGDDVLCVWGFTGDGYYGPGRIHANLWNGSSWGATADIANDHLLFEPEAFSVVGLGSTADICYLRYLLVNEPPLPPLNIYGMEISNYDSGTNAFSNSIDLTGLTEYRYDNYPVLSNQSNGSLEYLAWPETTFGANQLRYKVKVAGIWGATQTAVVGADIISVGGHYGYLFADCCPVAANYGVYWFDSSDNLMFSNALLPSGIPYGEATAVSGLSAHSATMNGHCTSDGSLVTTATFNWAGTGLDTQTISVGVVTTGESFSATLADLTPYQVYWYWVVFTNSAGNFSSNTITYRTYATSGPEAPIIQTLAVSDVRDTSAQLNGYLAWDGNLDCYLGFRWRVQGTTDWTEGMHGATGQWPVVHYATYRSPQSYSNTLTDLAVDTTYEYQALAKNGIAQSGIYGNSTTFTTSHYSGLPSPTPRPNPFPLPFNLSTTQKIMIGIIATLVLMVAVGYILRKSRGGAVIAIGAVAIGMTILFTVIAWYPMWIIIFIGILAGFGVLLMIGSKL